MKIHTWEKAFLATSAAVLVISGGSLFYITFGADIHLPGAHGRLDPRQVAITPPFDDPGVRQLPDGRYEAVVIGRAWSFQPAEIRVPAGVEVVFTATSGDVIHGFNLEGTRLNMMLIPGHVTQNTYTFDVPGEYLVICHEYCGLGHHTMFGRVIVEPAPAMAMGSGATGSSSDPDGRHPPPGGDLAFIGDLLRRGRFRPDAPSGIGPLDGGPAGALVGRLGGDARSGTGSTAHAAPGAGGQHDARRSPPKAPMAGPAHAAGAATGSHTAAKSDEAGQPPTGAAGGRANPARLRAAGSPAGHLHADAGNEYPAVGRPGSGS